MKRPLCLLLSALFFHSVSHGQTADQSLLAEINQIKAIDNHAHVMSSATDEELDAIACGGLEFIAPPPMRLRPDNPLYIGAWRALYGYRGGDDMGPERAREYPQITPITQTRNRALKESKEVNPTSPLFCVICVICGYASVFGNGMR